MTHNPAESLKKPPPVLLKPEHTSPAQDMAYLRWKETRGMTTANWEHYINLKWYRIFNERWKKEV